MATFVALETAGAAVTAAAVVSAVAAGCGSGCAIGNSSGCIHTSSNILCAPHSSSSFSSADGAAKLRESILPA